MFEFSETESKDTRPYKFEFSNGFLPNQPVCTTFLFQKVYPGRSKTVLVGSPRFFAALIYILNCTYIAERRLACFVASCIM